VFTHSFDNVTPPARYDGVAWTRVLVEEAAVEAGPFTQIAAHAIAADATPSTPDPIDVTVATATLERGWFRFRFDTGAGTSASPYTAAVFSPAAGNAAAFATREQVTARLRRESLDDVDAALCDYLLAEATGLIADAAGKDDAWAAALDPVPRVLRIVCVEAVVRVMLNPLALSTERERLGEHEYQVSHRNPNTAIGATGTGELALSDREVLLVRRAVHGRLSGSARVRSVADDVLPGVTGAA
jgi:hypothetical protein